jgi:hypothetical protein
VSFAMHTRLRVPMADIPTTAGSDGGLCGRPRDGPVLTARIQGRDELHAAFIRSTTQPARTDRDSIATATASAVRRRAAPVAMHLFRFRSLALRPARRWRSCRATAASPLTATMAADRLSPYCRRSSMTATDPVTNAAASRRSACKHTAIHAGTYRRHSTTAVLFHRPDLLRSAPSSLRHEDRHQRLAEPNRSGGGTRAQFSFACPGIRLHTGGRNGPWRRGPDASAIFRRPTPRVTRL